MQEVFLLKKVEVYLINGFLGSGKTTSLLKLMEYFKGKKKKYAIILNELGNVNMEQHLFKDEALYELLDGCICCSIKEGLKETLQEITEMISEEKLDILLLEGTGVANPSEIIDTFHDSEFIDTYIIQESICVIDSLHLTEYTSIFSSSKEVRQLQQEQIEHGSVLVLNKIDQLSSDTAIEKVEKRIRKYNHDAPLIHSIYGNGIMEYLEKNESKNLPKKNHINHHHHHIKSIKMEQPKEMTKMELRYFLKEYQEKLLRAKGTIKNRQDHEWYHFQYASGILEWERLKVQPKRMTGEIILIGENLTSKEIHI